MRPGFRDKMRSNTPRKPNMNSLWKRWLWSAVIWHRCNLELGCIVPAIRRQKLLGQVQRSSPVQSPRIGQSLATRRPAKCTSVGHYVLPPYLKAALPGLSLRLP
jgi:hypothetical protein